MATLSCKNIWTIMNMNLTGKMSEYWIEGTKTTRLFFKSLTFKLLINPWTNRVDPIYQSIWKHSNKRIVRQQIMEKDSQNKCVNKVNTITDIITTKSLPAEYVVSQLWRHFKTRFFFLNMCRWYYMERQWKLHAQTI